MPDMLDKAIQRKLHADPMLTVTFAPGTSRALPPLPDGTSGSCTQRIGMHDALSESHMRFALRLRLHQRNGYSVSRDIALGKTRHPLLARAR